MTTPKERPWYLLDPNYFKLAYQLAAQELNAMSAGSEQLDLPLSGEEMVPSFSVSSTALGDAKRVVAEARQALEYMKDEKDKPRPWWRKTYAATALHSIKFEEFLRKTIIPCSELLIAGAQLHSGDTSEAEDVARGLRARAKEGEISYRAFYNLACYETTLGASSVRHFHLPLEPGEEDQATHPFDRALRWLADAFKRIRGARRDELMNWASKDPTLQPLREHHRYSEAFDETLLRYGFKKAGLGDEEEPEGSAPVEA